MSNFTIQISDEFLSRFPEEERTLAAARARHILFGIEVGYNWRHLSTIMKMSEAELRQPYRFKDEMPESENFISCVPYFDENAVIEIKKKDGKMARLPALKLIGGCNFLWGGFYDELKDVIANHPNINYGGTYNTPFGGAVTSANFEMLTMLSFNPNFNPNHTASTMDMDRVVEVKDAENILAENDGRQSTENKSVIEEFTKNYNLDPEFFRKYPKSETIIRYFDRGAIVNEEALHNMMENAIFHRVVEHIAVSEERLETVTGSDYTAEDILHAYALNRLPALMQRMYHDPDAQDRLLELRQELPAWMNEILAPVYLMLSQTWVEATGQRSSNYTERS